MARELHDVVAHCMSVMVVQTSGARRVAASDLEAAREALKVVESAGREALVELRRIVGVLYRDDDEPAGASSGLAQLGMLVDRARAAGLPVELSVEGPRRSVSPGLDLVAYRIVQESLTNAIKHAGPADARVHVVFGARDLVLEITDNGRGAGTSPPRRRRWTRSDRNERARQALWRRPARRAAPGWRVRGACSDSTRRSRVRPAGAAPSPGLIATRSASRSGRSIAWRWLDPLLAAAFLVALEVMALTGSERGAVRVRDVLVLAAMALACIWRRRQPLWFLIVVVALVFPLSSNLAPASSLLTAVYVGLLPAYAVAAWEDRDRASLGLAILVLASAVGELLIRHVGAANYAPSLFTICAAWAAGRAIRARRAMDEALEQTTSLLAAERRRSRAVGGGRRALADRARPARGRRA